MEKCEYWNYDERLQNFLNIAHSHDFNNQLTHKIKDESLVKKFDYKAEYYCRCDNTQDLVLNKAMPWWNAEDAWIVELPGKVKDSTWLWQLTMAEMEDTVKWILKSYCNQNWVNFNDNNDYMLLYMYLMWPKWWYWWQWLSDLQNSSRSYFYCNVINRWFHSLDYDDIIASFFLWLLV